MEIPSFAANSTPVHELQERIKEPDCIYAISRMSANPNPTFDEILQNVADRVSLGLETPESACLCVTIFRKAANFKTSRSIPNTDLTAMNRPSGFSVTR